MDKRRSYTVHEVIAAGCTLEPMKCIHCGDVGEVTFDQRAGDAHCAKCGRWQLADPEGGEQVKRIVIYVSGGSVQYTAVEEAMEIVLLDADVRGTAPDTIELDWGEEGEGHKETCGAMILAPDTVDPEFVDRIYQQVDAEERRRADEDA